MSGATYPFHATITGSSNVNVTWSIQENPAGATPDGTIDANGVYTPPQEQSVSFVCHVVATSAADPSKSALATVNVWGDLVDHGGGIVPSTRTFVVWWGDPNGFAVDDRPEVEGFLKGLNGSPYLALADQYMHGGRASTSFGGSFIDTSAPAPDPTVDTITSTACAALNNNGISPVPGDVVFIDSASVTTQSWCGWHAWVVCQGQNVLLAYLPSHSGACSYNQPSCGTQATAESMSLVATTSHELMETITDPWESAWYASGEIADKCGSLSCVSFSTGTLSVTNLYSNQKHGCATQ